MESFKTFLTNANLLDTVSAWAINIVLALVIYIIGKWITERVARLCRKLLARAKMDPTLVNFLSNIVFAVLMIAVILAALDTLGIPVTSLLAIVGAAGLAVGLALKDSLGNFAAGVMLLIFRPYKVGDVIVVGSQTGKVDEIDLFSTTLDTPDNRRIMIPNGAIFGNTIENTSFHNKRRIDITIGVAFAADIDRTYEVLMRAACGVPGGLSTPEPEIVLLELTNSTVNWSVRVWTNSEDFGLVKQRTIRSVKLALDQAAIEIPFPQMDVNLKNTSAATSQLPADKPCESKRKVA